MQENEAQLKPIIDSKIRHLIILKELKAVHNQSEQKLKSFDTNMMKIRKEFLNTLAKS